MWDDCVKASCSGYMSHLKSQNGKESAYEVVSYGAEWSFWRFLYTATNTHSNSPSDHPPRLRRAHRLDGWEMSLHNDTSDIFFHVFAAFYNAIEPPRFLNQSFYAINRYSFVLLHFFNFPDIGPKTCEISDDAMTRSHIYRMIIKLCHNQIVVASNYW